MPIFIANDLDVMFWYETSENVTSQKGESYRNDGFFQNTHDIYLYKFMRTKSNFVLINFCFTIEADKLDFIANHDLLFSEHLLILSIGIKGMIHHGLEVWS